MTPIQKTQIGRCLVMDGYAVVEASCCCGCHTIYERRSAVLGGVCILNEGAFSTGLNFTDAALGREWEKCFVII